MANHMRFKAPSNVVLKVISVYIVVLVVIEGFFFNVPTADSAEDNLNSQQCISLSLDPSIRSVIVNEVFLFNLRLDANGRKFDTVTLDIHFDPEVLTVVNSSGIPISSIQQGNLNRTGPTLIARNSVNNIAGIIEYTEGYQGRKQAGGVFNIATIRFKAETVAANTVVDFFNIGSTSSETLTAVLIEGSVVPFCNDSPIGAIVTVSVPNELKSYLPLIGR